MRKILLPLAFAAACISACAQQLPVPTVDMQQTCTREFGEQFKLDPRFAPLTMDLDGDGRDDLVMVATAKNPLAGEMQYRYRAIDPYDGYFGWAHVKDTVQFSATNATVTRFVLVIHDWRAPKAKFVIINLPFDQLSTGQVASRKKKSALATIHAVEVGGLSADVYWDGKKYKWEPSYINADESPSAK
jgi:hypothetical protein